MPIKRPRFIQFWANEESSGANSRGFTFLEVIAAAALMAIVSLAIVAMFRGGIGAWEQGSSFVEAQRDLELAADRFARQIQQAQGPITVPNPQTVDIDRTATDNTHIYLELKVKDGSLSLVCRTVQAGTTIKEEVWVSKLSAGAFEMVTKDTDTTVKTVKITLTRQAATQPVTVETVASRRL